MSKTWTVKGLSLVFLLVLTACGGGDGGLCSSAAEGSLAPTCSPPRPGPSVSPVGSWQGTLTTTIGSSGTRPFTAEIDLVDSDRGTHEGLLNVGTETYRATGGFNPYVGEDHFALRTPLAELGASLSPGPPFYGVEWYGEMTENGWEGEWYSRSEDEERFQEGTFRLERLP